ncbi:MAG: helix-turn-helix transcriptional regulator [Bacteroidaceae bacterium]|nr:helix-turn-helix transcriptional regulator [Bacteroidaceae bacterium]
MTDKEKIELIIQDKHLNSTQFCNEVCIAQGTLSHIRSGRTEPTLNTLRSIAQAFPDINPAWLFYGEEPMYKKTDSPTPQEADADDTYIYNNDGGEEVSGDNQLSFEFSANGAPTSPKGNSMMGNGGSSSLSQGGGSSRRSSAQSAVSAPVNVQEIVAETLKQQQKPQRKVVEVRIFFDDGTFETFSAS